MAMVDEEDARFFVWIAEVLPPVKYSTANTQPRPLFSPNLHRDTFLHIFYVADHVDHLAAGVERVEGVQGNVQRVGVEGAEAFVEE
jgi:hypothetical protein